MDKEEMKEEGDGCGTPARQGGGVVGGYPDPAGVLSCVIPSDIH
jgi:hypothetical protein